MNNPSRLAFLQQRGLLITFLGSSGILIAAFAYEKMTGLLPCPLCWLQRGVFFGLALLSLIALLASRIKLIAWLLIAAFSLTSLTGVGIAIRHLYIKLNPSSVGCGLDVETLLDFFPLQEALVQMFMGSSDCAQAANFVGLPLPVWSLTGYLLLGSLAVFSLAKKTSSLSGRRF